MSMQAMLMPVFAQVALTFVLLFWMRFLRMRAIRRGQVPTPIRSCLESRTGLLALPRSATPIIISLRRLSSFMCLILLALVKRTADSILFVLSWLFVASRFVHAYIHLTSNRIDQRAPVFLVGAIGLALMWIIIAARLTIAAAG